MSQAELLSEAESSFFLETLRGRPVMDLQINPHFPELFLVSYGAVSGFGSTSPNGSSSSSGAAGLSALSAASGSGLTSAGSVVGSEREERAVAEGMVCVWSTIFPTTPEYVFVAPSPVLTARFHPDDAHLIVGGCLSGQILVPVTLTHSHTLSLTLILALTLSLNLTRSLTHRAVALGHACQEPACSAEQPSGHWPQTSRLHDPATPLLIGL